METLSRDEFVHLIDLNELLTEMDKEADWTRSEILKEIIERINKDLKKFVITVERSV